MADSQTEIRLLYKEIASILRNDYTPHYNLYQKIFLKEKMKCYEQNTNSPHQYYQCISDVDERMIYNSQNLQRRFNTIEVDSKTSSIKINQINEKQCEENCTQSFVDNENQRKGCILKCMQEMKEQCVQLQKSYYSSILKDNPEYKKLQK